MKDPAPPPQNPLLGDFTAPFGVPPFDAIRTEHYLPALRAGIDAQLKAIKAIVNDPAPPDFDNTVAALDYSGLGLARTARIFRGLFSANTNDALDKLAEQVTPLLTAHQDQIMLDPGLFARLKQVYAKRASLKLTAEQRTLLEEYHLQFVRSGAELEAKAKVELQRINKELALAMLQFSQNVRKEDNGFALTLDRQEDLAGLPQRVIGAAAEAARERKQPGKWVFTLHKPSLLPFLQHSRRRELRQRLFTAYIRRGANGNAQDNRALIKTIMALRIKKANMLGVQDLGRLRPAAPHGQDAGGRAGAAGSRLGRRAPRRAARGGGDAKADRSHREAALCAAALGLVVLRREGAQGPL